MRRRAIAVLLFISGCLVFCYPGLARELDRLVQTRQAGTIKDQLVAARNGQTAISGLYTALQTYNAALDVSIAPPDGLFPADKLTGFLPALDQLGGEDVYGLLEIPRLDLTLPIYLGATSQHLQMGAAQIEGTSLPIGGQNTHTVLAGHHGFASKELFSNINRLQKGDQFYIYNLFGRLTYQVTGNRVIRDDDTHYLRIFPGQDLVSLLTCFYNGPRKDRLMVFAERVPDEAAPDENKPVVTGPGVMNPDRTDLAGPDESNPDGTDLARPVPTDSRSDNAAAASPSEHLAAAPGSEDYAVAMIHEISIPLYPATWIFLLPEILFLFLLIGFIVLVVWPWLRQNTKK